MYFRTTDDQRILIGGEDEKFQNAKRRDALLTAKSRKLEKQVQRLLPEEDFVTDFSWTGTFGATKDGLPYIGAHPSIPHSYFVLGFGGNGITFSVIGMEMISALLKNKRHPLEAYFRFGR
ncbi:MAG: FAD-binding oxidoreductase [Chitinophagaceae bacterium]|nr:FAD-binding oxidoreductase [Chitinophagaceae bacterium]